MSGDWLRGIKNDYLRRAVLVLLLPIGAVCCLVLVVAVAAKEYLNAIRDTPEEFMRVWKGYRHD